MANYFGKLFIYRIRNTQQQSVYRSRRNKGLTVKVETLSQMGI